MELPQLLIRAQQTDSVACAMGRLPGFWDRLLEESNHQTRLSRRCVLTSIVAANRWVPPAAKVPVLSMPSRA